MTHPPTLGRCRSGSCLMLSIVTQGPTTRLLVPTPTLFGLSCSGSATLRIGTHSIKYEQASARDMYVLQDLTRNPRIDEDRDVPKESPRPRRTLLSLANAADFLGLSTTQFSAVAEKLGLQPAGKLWDKFSHKVSRTRWDPDELKRIENHPEVVAARLRRKTKKRSP